MRNKKIIINTVDAARSEQMRRIRSKDTGPELRVRRALFALGYRYRLHLKSLPGQPDLTFIGRKKVIFVHGCFWHRHENCRKTRMPKSKLDYWIPKFTSNIKRDHKNQADLLAAGWKFFIVWECELKNMDDLLQRITSFLKKE